MIWNCDQVNVIGHQAISQNGEAPAFASIAQEIEIKLVVARVEKNLLPGIAPLSNVIRNPLLGPHADL